MDPKGTVSCRIQGESVRLSIHLSICTSDRWTDGRMNRRTDSPCILQDILPVLTSPLFFSIIDIYGKLTSLGAGAGAPSSLWCLRNESSSYSVLDGKPTSDENNKLDFRFLNCTVDCVSRDSYTGDPYLKKILYGFV